MWVVRYVCSGRHVKGCVVFARSRLLAQATSIEVVKYTSATPTPPQQHHARSIQALVVSIERVERSLAACDIASSRSTGPASSSRTRGLRGPRVRLLRRELTRLLDFDVGSEGEKFLMLLARVDGTLDPSCVLPGPGRYCVLRDSWLLRREPASRSKEFAREAVREFGCERWYSGSSARSIWRKRALPLSMHQSL